MKLSTLDFIKLLPVFMRDDTAIQGLSDAMNEIIPPLSKSMRLLTTWDVIDQLSEKELDDLAWELNILWYEKGADVEVKREIIKNSDKIYQHLGTKWSVENVIETYFGDGIIREWFEYEGTPGHFRVYSTNPTVTNERLGQFLNLLFKVKRASSHLDGIYITLTGIMNLHADIALHEVTYESYTLGKDDWRE